MTVGAWGRWALAGVAVAAVGWRLAARRRSLPCPAALSWLVEGPMADRLLGTRETLERLDLRPGQRVLEVGPGPGRLLIPAARRVLPGGEAVGLDIQPGMVERLRERARAAGVANLAAVVGDAAAEHFPPGSFDVAYLATVLGEIPDREGALRRVHAALRPGGALLVTEVLPDPHYQSRAEVRRLGEAAGFRWQASFGSPVRHTATFRRPP